MTVGDTGSILVELRFDDAGLIASIRSTGHATKERGTAFSTCCALISASLRSFSRLIVESGGMVIQGEAPEPGRTYVEIKRIEPSVREWYRGLCELTVRSLDDISLDFPRIVTIKRIKGSSGGDRHGT